MSLPHRTVPILVIADIDEGIADLVLYLNTIPGVRTHTACQGTIGEGGPNPYRPQVMCSWETSEAHERLLREFDITIPEECNGTWAYVHPKDGATLSYQTAADNLYNRKFWPWSNELSDETEVTTTAGYLRKLRDRCMGAECNEGYVIADLQVAQERIKELEAGLANPAAEIVAAVDELDKT